MNSQAGIEPDSCRSGSVVHGDHHLADKISQSTFFGVLANGVQVGTRLLTVPIVIQHLGLGGYGIWSIVMVTVAYMRFGTAGVKSAFQKYVAEATSTKQFDNANQLISTGAISMLILSLIGLFPIAIYSTNLARASGVPPEFLLAAARSITVLALILVVANFGAAYEAIVMGGQRVDLARKFNICTTIGEAIAIIIFLRFGFGLLAMSIIMALSELIYISACYLASKRVVPEIRVKWSNVSARVFPELFRFAGSFQLINVLEVLYATILPIVVLRYYGAESAGIYALATRVATSAMVAQDALSLSILSGAAAIFVSNSVERIQRFVRKSFKAMFIITTPALAFVSVFGPTLVLAWTGQSAPLFRSAIAMVSLAGLFKSISLLQLVLYRATGKALLDNIRQILRIVVLLVVAAMGKSIGFYGLLIGCAAAELCGMIFMFLAMAATFRGFTMKFIAFDTMKVFAATALIIAAGWCGSLIPVYVDPSQRIGAAMRLVAIGVITLVSGLPALIVTGAISVNERSMLLQTVFPWRKKTQRSWSAAEV